MAACTGSGAKEQSRKEDGLCKDPCPPPATKENNPRDCLQPKIDKHDTWEVAWHKLANVGWARALHDSGRFAYRYYPPGSKKPSEEMQGCVNFKQLIRSQHPHWRGGLSVPTTTYEPAVSLPERPMGSVPPPPIVLPGPMPLDDVHKMLELHLIKHPDEGIPSVEQFREMEKMATPGKDWYAWHEALPDRQQQLAEHQYQQEMARVHESLVRVRPYPSLLLGWDMSLFSLHAKKKGLCGLWERLEQNGWRHCFDNGRELFKRPDCPDNARRDGREFYDYFLELEDLVRYVRYMRPDLAPAGSRDPPRLPGTLVAAYAMDNDLHRLRLLLKMQDAVSNHARGLIFHRVSDPASLTEPDRTRRATMRKEFGEAAGGHRSNAGRQHQGGKETEEECMAREKESFNRWLSVPGVIAGISKDTKCRCEINTGANAVYSCECILKTHYWEGRGNEWVVRTSHTRDIRDILQGCIGEGCYEAVKLAVCCAPPSLFVKIPYHFYPTKLPVITKIRYAGPDLLEGLATTGITVLLPLGWIGTAVSVQDAPLDKELKSNMRAHILSITTRLEYFALPGGSRKRKGRDSRPTGKHRHGHSVTGHMRVPIFYQMDPTSMSCYPSAAAASLYLYGRLEGLPALEECAAYMSVEGVQLATGAASNRKVTNFLELTLQCVGISLVNIEDHTLPVILSKTERIMLLCVCSKRAYPHYVGVVGGRIVDPAETHTLELSRTSLDQLCGGVGEFLRIKWAAALSHDGERVPPKNAPGIVMAASASLRHYGLAGTANSLLSQTLYDNKEWLCNSIAKLIMGVKHLRLRMRHTAAVTRLDPKSGCYVVLVAEMQRHPGVYVSFARGRMFLPPYRESTDIDLSALEDCYGYGFAWAVVVHQDGGNPANKKSP